MAESPGNTAIPKAGNGCCAVCESFFTPAARPSSRGMRAANKTQAGFCVNGFVAVRENRRFIASAAFGIWFRLKKGLVRGIENC
jgi:hypothetical protein